MCHVLSLYVLYVCYQVTFVCFLHFFFFFKQKTAYEMRISDWSSDVCSSDLPTLRPLKTRPFRSVSPSAATWSVRSACRTAVFSRLISRLPPSRRLKIGRASCRERVCQYV